MISIRRTNEGLECLVFTPDYYPSYCSGVTLFHNDLSLEAPLPMIVPIGDYEPVTMVIPGSPNSVTIPISMGCNKAGFPEGSSCEDFHLVDLAQILVNRYGVASSKAKLIQEYFSNCCKCTSRADVDLGVACFLKQHVGLASCFPGLLTPFVEGVLADADALELKERDVRQAQEIVAVINGDSFSKRAFLSEAFIRKIAKVGDGYVIGGTEEIRGILSRVMGKLLASFSTTNAFNAFDDEKKLEEFLA